MIGTESAAEPGWVSKPLAEDMIVVAASERHEVFRTRATGWITPSTGKACRARAFRWKRRCC